VVQRWIWPPLCPTPSSLDASASFAQRRRRSATPWLPLPGALGFLCSVWLGKGPNFYSLRPKKNESNTGCDVTY
jgi:hypothetical protein